MLTVSTPVNPGRLYKSSALLLAEREAWQRLVEDRCGTYFPDGRFHVLEACIRERMETLGEPSTREYFNLASGQTIAGRAEWKVLVTRMLNGDTAFFRHPDSFQALSRMILPQLIRERGEDRRPFSLWSAGCSTGEETYSIAAVALSHGLGPDRVQVCGTDLNEAALAKAREGVYTRADVMAIPEDLRSCGFRQAHTTRGPALEAGAPLKEITSFGLCNLVETEQYLWDQDVIVCQNVLIYFRDVHKSRVIARFKESLRPGGYLILAPSDAISVQPASLEPVRAGHLLVYRKTR